MEKTRERINKFAKILTVICRIFMVLSIIQIVAAAITLTVSFTNPDIINKQIESTDIEPVRLFDITIEGSTPMIQFRLSQAVEILGGIVYLLLLRFMLSLINTISKGSSPFTKEVAKKLRFAAYVALAAGLVYGITALIIFMLLLMFSALFEYGDYLQQKADETGRIQEEMIVSFAEITENKSTQTGRHVRRVSEYSRLIAKAYGLSDEEAERIRLASTMHDIGKLLIPSEILEKPARLTDEEFSEIKKHSGYGGMLLENVEGDIMELSRRIALDHHERVDGKGYPDGKQGDEISIEGKIVAIADVYDALTSRRSYKEPWEESRAYDEIIKGRGTQFDSAAVDAFKSVYPEINKLRAELAD